MPRPFSQFRGEAERSADERRAQVLQRQLAGEVSAVATTFVDHSGAARVKTVPLSGLASAARSGLGFSPGVDAFTSAGGIDEASPLCVPDGDLRMVPDLDRLLLGDGNYAQRFQNFLNHYPEIRKGSPLAKVFDLRLDGRITVDRKSTRLNSSHL